MKTLKTKLIATTFLSFVFVTGIIVAQPNFINESEYSELDVQIESWMSNIDEFGVIILNENNEPEIGIEDWMTNMDSFYGYDYEEPVEIENWMTNMDAFYSDESKTYSTLFSGEYKEELLQVEPWMLSMDEFNTNKVNTEFLLAESQEEPLSIEAWMVNLNAYFNAPIHAIPSINEIELIVSEPKTITLACNK